MDLGVHFGYILEGFWGLEGSWAASWNHLGVILRDFWPLIFSLIFWLKKSHARLCVKSGAEGGDPYNNQSRFPSQGDPGLQGHGPIPGGYPGPNVPYGHAPCALGHGGGSIRAKRLWRPVGSMSPVISSCSTISSRSKTSAGSF